MRETRKSVIVLLFSAFLPLLTACQPSDRQPGFWLSGEAESFPDNWLFSDEYREIGVEVSTPYLLPHSVTIWCVQVDGNLYIAASKPETKNWPDWVEKNPDVRLKIGERLFDVRLKQLEEPDVLTLVSKAYIKKYELKGSGIGGTSRTWSVEDRTVL